MRTHCGLSAHWLPWFPAKVYKECPPIASREFPMFNEPEDVCGKAALHTVLYKVQIAQLHNSLQYM